MSLREIVDACARIDVGGKPLQECMRLGRHGFSAYWLGPLAEKNPLKTPELAGAPLRRRGFTQAALEFTKIAWKVIYARLMLGKPPGSIPPGSLLCVTYFPYLEPGPGYRNRYFTPLQDAARDEGVQIHWLLIHVNVDSHGFRDTIRLAREFRGQGEWMWPLESFIGLGDLAWMAVALLRNVIAYSWLRMDILRVMTSADIVPPDWPLARELIRRAFCGPEAVRGLFYLRAFGMIMHRAGKGSRCLYLAEAQSWEAALCGIAREHGVRTLAYPHSLAARSATLWRHGPVQMRETPLPDTVLCDGEGAVEKFKGWGYNNVVMVESLRNLRLASVKPDKKDCPRYLLLAGTIRRDETEALLDLLQKALPDLDGWEVHVKSHPSCPIGEIDPNIHVDYGDISYALERAHVVLTGTSSVAAEALAHGCDVILAAFPGIPFLNVLGGHEKLYRMVYTPGQLISALHWNRQHGLWATRKSKREFRDRFWCLDPALPRWRSVMKETSAQ